MVRKVSAEWQQSCPSNLMFIVIIWFGESWEVVRLLCMAFVPVGRCIAAMRAYRQPIAVQILLGTVHFHFW